MEQTLDIPPAGSKPGRKPSRKSVLIAVAALCSALAVLYLCLCLYAGQRNTFFPHVFINGVEVSALTEAEAQQRLCQVLPSRTVTLTDGETAETLHRLPLSALGYSPAVFAPLAQACMEQQADTSFFLRGWNFLAHLAGRQRTVRSWPEPEAPLFASAVTQLTQQLSCAPIHGTYVLEADTIAVTCPQNGRAVTETDLAVLRTPALWDADFQVALPFETLPANGLTAQQVANALCGEMQNAGYDSATGSITPERIGVSFDIDAAQRAMDAAAPGETLHLPAQIRHPTGTAEALRPVLFRDVLGECRTAVSGTAARKNNVRLAASAIDGLVLGSGQVFSFNGTVGQRTAARGYQPAPAYVQGETVDEIGGGICQVSSTLYLACLRSNLEITERYAHRYTPAYIDWGMDATVSWGGPDYRFTNDTDYPLKISAVYENGWLTVRLLGTNLSGRSAKITAETVSATPWKTVYQEDASLAPGTEQVKTTPYAGYTVKTYRSVYSADGTWISTVYEATSSYKARDMLILKGPEVSGSLPAGTKPPPSEPASPNIPAAADAVLPRIPKEPAKPAIP